MDVEESKMTKNQLNQNSNQNQDPEDEKRDENAQQNASSTGTMGDVKGEGEDEQNNGAAAAQPAERTFSQSDVSRMMAREKKQGRNSVYNELGIDPNDARSIELIKTLMGAQKAQGEQDATAVAAEADQRLIEAENRALMAEAKVEAMELGVQPQFVDDVVTLAMARMAEQGEGAEFKTIIGEMKTKYSAWFTPSGDERDSKGQKGTGSSIPPESGSNASKKDDGIGKRLAAQRKPSKKNFSYWGK